MGGATVGERYEELGLADALSRAHDYPAACHELGLILRLAYAHLPKNLQAVVFRDTLSAFGFLPEVQTGQGISSANILLQAAEVALPKQKKALAVSEFKHFAVAHKRRSKAHHDESSLNLPHDVLVHVFSFLDLRSLASVGSVCWYHSLQDNYLPCQVGLIKELILHFISLRRAWNSAASDDGLWKMLYSNLFDNHDTPESVKADAEQQSADGKLVSGKKQKASLEGGSLHLLSFNWKNSFRRKCRSSWNFLPNRLICKHCRSMIWLSGITCRTSHKCSKIGDQKLNMRPITPNKVVVYLLGETESETSSDSDDDDQPGGPLQLSKLWAYPRLTSTSS